MKRRTPGLKSTDYKASGIMPAALSGRDMALRMSRHPEHETGETPRSRTRRQTRSVGVGDIGLFTIPQWHRDARCAHPLYADLDFFPDGAGRRIIGRLLKVCAACPVRAQCLDEALRLESDSRLCYGVRGGVPANQRLKLVRENEVGIVYFGWANGLIKIGTTRQGARQRAAVWGITLLATEPGSFAREAALHEQFGFDRDHGEWFRPSHRLLTYIGSLPDQYVGGQRFAAAGGGVESPRNPAAALNGAVA